MAYATLNGFGVLEARVAVPRVGAWVADLSVNTSQALSGAVTLDLNGYQLKGTVRRGGVALDTCVVKVVGGAGGLPKLLPAASYRAVPLSVPLRDVLTAGGEVLAGDSDQSVLGANLRFWSRMAGPAGVALGLLALQGGESVAWRVGASGLVWVGKETWPASRLGSYQVLREDPLNGRLQFFAETPELEPGTTLQGRKVSYVEHSVSENKLRSVAWFEP